MLDRRACSSMKGPTTGILVLDMAGVIMEYDLENSRAKPHVRAAIAHLLNHALIIPGMWVTIVSRVNILARARLQPNRSSVSENSSRRTIQGRRSRGSRELIRKCSISENLSQGENLGPATHIFFSSSNYVSLPNVIVNGHGSSILAERKRARHLERERKEERKGSNRLSTLRPIPPGGS